VVDKTKLQQTWKPGGVRTLLGMWTDAAEALALQLSLTKQLETSTLAWTSATSYGMA
jgi:hypothetical protein